MQSPRYWAFKRLHIVEARARQNRVLPHPHIIPAKQSPENREFLDTAEKALLDVALAIEKQFGRRRYEQAEPDFEYDGGIKCWRLFLKLPVLDREHTHTRKETSRCSDSMMIVEQETKFPTSWTWRVPMFKHRLSTEAKKMDAESKQKLDLEIDDEWTVLGESDFVDELDKASVTAECGEEIGNDEEDDMGFEILGEERDMKHKDNFVVAPLA